MFACKHLSFKNHLKVYLVAKKSTEEEKEKYDFSMENEIFKNISCKISKFVNFLMKQTIKKLDFRRKISLPSNLAWKHILCLKLYKVLFSWESNSTSGIHSLRRIKVFAMNNLQPVCLFPIIWGCLTRSTVPFVSSMGHIF